MLEFFSASTRMVNPQRAVLECLESALGGEAQDCNLVIVHASVGHDLRQLVDPIRRQCPGARVVGASCAGIVGREGVSESLKDVALMAVRGREFAVAHVEGIYGHNAYAKAVELATRLHAADPGVRMVFLLAPGIDIANDQVLAGIEAVLGPEVTIFGATASDNMRGLATYQAVDAQVFEHAACAVGFSDPTLEVDTQATHGFVASGEPLRVTRSAGNRIITLDGRPAWQAYTARLGLPATATLADTIPIGALAERLPPELAAEYGNDHLLRVVTHREADGVMVYPTECPEGTELWLTVRDEARIFADMDRMVARMRAGARGRVPVAVFQADCLARGRRLFNRIIKEELVARMQHPFSTAGSPPPWLGMYGFGEYARLGGANAYHNYTTALAALYRN